ncbi:MAG: cell envelope integrity protein TolA [Deltaproteobacteria bacterium]|nr:cell envelope integrity protein TolA [Deltaproteobacteria bacterium]
MERHFASANESWGRWVPSLDENNGFWRWLLFSILLHAVLISGLIVLPRGPSRKSLSYPVYTVDLVGGEKLGGSGVDNLEKRSQKTVETKMPVKEPAKPVKPAQKSVREEKKKEQPAPRSEIPPKEKKEKILEKTRRMNEEATLRESIKGKEIKQIKKETTADKEPPKEAVAEQRLPGQVREKLIEAALGRIKERAEAEQKKSKVNQATSTSSAEGQGAVALGKGGTGGGIVKGVEYIRYQNQIRSLIKDSWTWVGKRIDLEVTVRFGIRDNGEIVGLKIVRASGDPSYDESVIRALRRASPLPPPPENYRKEFMDVAVTFRPQDLGG